MDQYRHVRRNTLTPAYFSFTLYSMPLVNELVLDLIESYGLACMSCDVSVLSSNILSRNLLLDIVSKANLDDISFQLLIELPTKGVLYP